MKYYEINSYRIVCYFFCSLCPCSLGRLDEGFIGFSDSDIYTIVLRISEPMKIVRCLSFVRLFAIVVQSTVKNLTLLLW